MQTLDEIAERAYGAYGKSTDNKNYQGKQMPAWSDLPEAIRTAWVAAVTEVLKASEPGDE